MGDGGTEGGRCNPTQRNWVAWQRMHGQGHMPCTWPHGRGQACNRSHLGGCVAAGAGAAQGLAYGHSSTQLQRRGRAGPGQHQHRLAHGWGGGHARSSTRIRAFHRVPLPVATPFPLWPLGLSRQPTCRLATARLRPWYLRAAPHRQDSRHAGGCSDPGPPERSRGLGRAGLSARAAPSCSGREGRSKVGWAPGQTEHSLEHSLEHSMEHSVQHSVQPAGAVSWKGAWGRAAMRHHSSRHVLAMVADRQAGQPHLTPPPGQPAGPSAPGSSAGGTSISAGSSSAW